MIPIYSTPSPSDNKLPRNRVLILFPINLDLEVVFVTAVCYRVN